MKYVAIIRYGSSQKIANIFNDKEGAKKYLQEVASVFKYPSKVKWENNFKFIINTSLNESVLGYVVQVEKAEYRLNKHLYKEKDEERRFFTRENALNFVSEHDGNISEDNNDFGYWPSDSVYDVSYKLYATILDGGDRSKVKYRYDSLSPIGIMKKSSGVATGVSVNEVNKEQDKKNVAGLIRKVRTFLNEKRFNKKLVFGLSAAVLAIIAIAIINLDWQLISDERKARQYSISSEMEKVAEELHLTRKGKAVLFATQPKFLGSRQFNETCGRDGSSDVFTAGCYYKDDNEDEHIEIYDVGVSTLSENGVEFNFGDYRRMIVLHEMLHAVWERQNDDKQTNICSNLKEISSQIPELKTEMELYNSSQQCTELFSRVGTEYIPHLISGKVSLNSSEKEIVSQVSDVYDDYFEVNYNANVDKYWNNENQLSNFEKKILVYSYTLDSKKNSTQALINSYYAWPTWARYNSANSSIAEYNNMVSTFNSYVDTYNRIYERLDSERVLKSSVFLGL